MYHILVYHSNQLVNLLNYKNHALLQSYVIEKQYNINKLCVSVFESFTRYNDPFVYIVAALFKTSSFEPHLNFNHKSDKCFLFLFEVRLSKIHIKKIFCSEKEYSRPVENF